MGYLVKGQWQIDDNLQTDGGYCQEQQNDFRHWVKADGSTEYTPDLGRYHLFLALACSASHNVLIFHTLKKLSQVISLSTVAPIMSEQGWSLSENQNIGVDDQSYLHQIYTLTEARYSGPSTVPLLWDKKTKQIVNNDPLDIVYMLNSEFDQYGDASVNFYPANMQDTIDEINAIIANKISDGLHKCGFAKTQAEYDTAFDMLFLTLDLLEERLSRQRYLVGRRITEADWRLFTILIRFDTVYFSLFKCNQRRIADYPCLSNYLRELYQTSGIAETVNFSHIKNHYYLSYPHLNPTKIVPAGPKLNLWAPHNRDRIVWTGEKSAE